jgi:hypothetical protein
MVTTNHNDRISGPSHLVHFLCAPGAVPHLLTGEKTKLFFQGGLWLWDPGANVFFHSFHLLRLMQDSPLIPQFQNHVESTIARIATQDGE